MKLAHKKNEVRHIVADWHQQRNRVALVPTMGALHDGHISLIRHARQHADHVVVSIFVNPAQFGPGEDYEQYPRSLNNDVEICRKEGVALVFAPDQDEMYGPEGTVVNRFISFHISKMNEHLCGASRKGHFEGVLLVVNKLFNIVRPDVVVFGQKDIQQWFIVRQMVEEQDHQVEVLMCPTIRNADGFAWSSRNVCLTKSERGKAPMLYEALQRITGKLSDNREQASPGRKESESGVKAGYVAHLDKTLISAEITRLEKNGFMVDYLSVVSAPDLQPVDVIKPERQFVIAVAAWLGETRLIDNILLNTKNVPDYDS